MGRALLHQGGRCSVPPHRVASGPGTVIRAPALVGARGRHVASCAAHSLESAQSLRDWLVAAGSSMPSELMPAQGVSKGGYGMVCTAPVAQGQDLVSVPRRLLMTAETARQAPECGKLVTGTGLTEWQSLVLQLLCERAKGSSSFWAPYIAMLPDQTSHPLMWGPEQLAWLEGSPLLSVLTQRQVQVREDTEALLIAGANEDITWSQQQQQQQQQQQSLVTESSVRWAACTLLSRAFSLDLSQSDARSGGDDDEEAEEGTSGELQGQWSGGFTPQAAQDALALVPWADMLCHSSAAGPESCLRYCPDSGCVRLAAHTSYSPGQEVYDSYGPNLSPGDLLLDYGFVDAGNSNHKVEVEPRNVAAPSSGRARTLLGALEAVQGADVRMALGPRGPDQAFLTWLRAAVASDAELIRAGWRVKASEKDVELACRVMGRLSEPLSLANENKVLSALASYTDRQLKCYPSSLEQDQQEEQQLALQEDQGHWLRCQVLRALVSEKTALVCCQEVVSTWQQRLQDGVPVADLYADWDWGYGHQEEGWDEEDEEGELP